MGKKANKRCLAPKGWGEDRLMLILGLAYKYFHAQHVEHLRCSTPGRPVRLSSDRLRVGSGPTRKLRSTAQKKDLRHRSLPRCAIVATSRPCRQKNCFQVKTNFWQTSQYYAAASFRRKTFGRREGLLTPSCLFWRNAASDKCHSTKIRGMKYRARPYPRAGYFYSFTLRAGFYMAYPSSALITRL